MISGTTGRFTPAVSVGDRVCCWVRLMSGGSDTMDHSYTTLEADDDCSDCLLNLR